MPMAARMTQTNELSPGRGKVIEADGRSIALFNMEGHILCGGEHLHWAGWAAGNKVS